MNLKRFWSPGIAGFIILTGVFLYTYKPGERFIESSSGLVLLTMPLTTVLCIGSIVKVFLEHESKETTHNRSKVLQWFDIIFGFIGICVIVFFSLVVDPYVSYLSDRIFPLIFIIIISGLGYVLFSKWKGLTLLKKMIFTIIWIIVCIISCFTFLSSISGEVPLPTRDIIVDDLNNLAAHSYQYRIRPSSMGGGEGSYVGYIIPKGLSSRENRSYSIISISADTLVFRGTSSDRNGTIKVKVNKDGRLMDWKFQGELDPEQDDWRFKVWETW